MTDRPTPAGTPRSKRRSNPLLSLHGITKLFRLGRGLRTQHLRALCDVSLDVHPGEIVALVGESGSGKSTILRLIARLDSPTSGEIVFRGQEILKIEPRGASLDYRKRVQMIFQDPFGSLNPVHTVGHHLTRPLRRHGLAKTKKDATERVTALLALVGLSPAEEFINKRPHQLSGGQRQRVAIARALAVEPELILADEPTSMLDVSIRMGILNLLDDLKIRRGLGYLFVTHDIASARYLADRILVMYAGHVVEEGPTEPLLRDPRHPYTRLLLEAVPHAGGSIFRPLPARSGQPQLIDPPPGCPFAPRCLSAEPRCMEESPRRLKLAVQPGDAARFVRCHLYEGDEVAEPSST